MLKKINLLGVGITASSMDEILEYITTSLKNKKEKWFIVTPNPEMVALADKDFGFRSILNGAEVALPDGMGLVWASKLLRKPLTRRITGVEMVEKLCEKSGERGLVLGFLGGQNGVADRAVDCLRKKCPKLKAGFVGSEWPESVGNSSSLASELPRSASGSNIHLSRSFKLPPSDINGANQPLNPWKSIDILFVAFGFPKQERWIYENLEKLPVKCAMGVGGAFDFISGNVPRAPKFVQYAGLEWLFRLIIQPWRWKRQLALVEFVYLIVKEIVKVRFRFANKI